MTDRFEVDIGDKGLMIYDNEGIDDYYFVNDKKELQKFCDLINNQPDPLDELKKELINHKNITKSLSQEILELSESFNQVKEENQRLKEALLFFIECSNIEFSSNFKEDMEKDCQKIFNCSYKEAKEKYGNFDTSFSE